ncbi:DAK2 domain-containing protein [Streptomyces daliensis]|uniref:DAK2 domain-containing protein n=1 Tax=Streptomyces daliensis TaxID=299421 RepID=A0A8T4ILU8_9ACTN|nr:DAK2 domain-containing protein [Streptomyces daliensis]
MPHPLDSAAVRTWCALALEALDRGREETDAINVFPVADGDTGTNLYRTLEAAARALDAYLEGGGGQGAGGAGGAGGVGEETSDTRAGSGSGAPSAAGALAALARGALLGACGNSGTILAQLLRGMAESAQVARATGTAGQGEPEGADFRLAAALRRAAESAYEAVARPVEGTMLTVATAAADAAEDAAGNAAASPDGTERAAVVARAAYEGARAALAGTTGQLDVLARAGVVDAGGRGLTAVLGALAEALDGAPEGARESHGARGGTVPSGAGVSASGEGDVTEDTGTGTGPAYEVMYLMEADEEAVRTLRRRLDKLGDSLVVIGGDGLWNVHVHVADAGAAVEAGIEAGRPYRVRITHLPAADAHGAHCDHGAAEHADHSGRAPATGRAVVAVVPGDGLAGLCEEAGATVVRAVEAAEGEESVGHEALLEALCATGAAEAVLLPNDYGLRETSARAAHEARARGVRVAVIPTRAAVQGIAALAVHEPGRDFDEDVVAMTAAAGATRYGEVTFAEHQSWTMAGICQAGDVLGLVEGDVAVIGADVAEMAADVLERMLAAGGEMVTLVLGADAPPGLAARLEEQVRRGHLAVDTVVYEGRQQTSPVLIGVE